jgi:hypothetical protein
LTLRALICLLAVVCTLACSGARPAPKPTTALPTRFPTPSQNAAPGFGEEAADVEAAFRSEVQQATDTAHFLAGAPCDRLAGSIKEDPTLVTGLRAYAATLKRVAARDQALDLPATPYVLAPLDYAMDELDRTLASCGITV